MDSALAAKIVLFLASLSPNSLGLQEISNLKSPSTSHIVTRICQKSQQRMDDDAPVFAFAKLFAASKNQQGNWQGLDSDKLKSLPDDASTCCEVLVSAMAAQQGQKEALAKRLAIEAQRRIVKLPVVENSDALIVRELAVLLSNHFRSVDDSARQEEMLKLEAQITLTRFTTSPHLVGATIVRLADFRNASKPASEKSADFYEKVILDLGYLVDAPDNFPHVECYEALYWLKRSCLAVHEIKGDQQAKKTAEKVAALLENEKVDESIYAEPRFGLLAKLYCSQPHFIAIVINQCLLSSSTESDRKNLRLAGHRFACSTADLDYYQLGLETQVSNEIIKEIGIGKRTLNNRDDRAINDAIKILDEVVSEKN